ncbi:PDZ/DHR/GLGF domain protein [Rhodopirellula maiorica SM1]|uniref:PDZ/DHR/GLGF domain protein n=1 Tax=Rhodopirellula maiorica SM1 TaxID=1265738 RepID=M5RUJ4_9BACT|nr:PDZ/DHR/GLGF domain protein [Rhodopirellula maiorica SM1]
MNIDQLFINGVSQRMARYPNYDPAKKAEPYQGYSADAFSKERAAHWKNPAGGYIHAMHRASWGGYHYRITGKDESGEVTYEGGWQNNRQMGMHKDYRMVENIFEELDAAGEWFHDASSSTLYYQPAADVNLDTAKVEVVRLRHLIEINGSEANPVHHMTFQGFTVRHAARTFMDSKEPLLRSDWTIYRGGAILLTGTEQIQILDTEFDQVGGNAVFASNYNRDVLVQGCHIHDTGASGVCFVGDPDAVRDPLFEYGQTNDLSKIDRTVGPKTNNYPADCVVDDCLIHGIGRVERQPAGVQISMAQDITVRDCSIYDTARAGINVSEGTWGGHLIQRCDVFDTVLETHDHGSFNSWGRDRYWRRDSLTTSQKAVDEDPQLPFLDAMKTTVIRDSRWRCDHGWDIDLDDGSSNYDIYNNLLLNKGLKLREGFRRHAYNNVMPVGWFHPHVWFQGSNDRVYSNIFSNRHSPARMSRPYTRGETMVDRNFFATTNPEVLDFSKRLGWDANSLLGDPMYVDPENGDFRVKEGSPALKVGFENFPMDQFGVKKPSLKAIARTPEIPDLKTSENKPTRKQPPLVEKVSTAWQGALLQDLQEEDFSAYGASKEEGGVALEKVTADFAAAKAGLLKGDLIQAVNGKSVANIKQFLRAVQGSGDEPLKLTILRNQKPMELSIQPSTTVVIESAQSSVGFKKLVPPAASTHKITTNRQTSNEPLATLTDGKLAANYGPVFANGINDGKYKMDLGAVKPVTAISSWSFRQSKNRSAQKLTIFASDSEQDPGWNLDKMTPIGTIDTGVVDENYTAASLRAVNNKTLGHFRWILWSVSPVSDQGGGENTTFQELAVELANPTVGSFPKPANNED